ncbi:MAG: hypothetical protein LC098_09260 [Burkholderiales bacterium]|nr:hypothetical protein [Burkholderiales bacterium]
MVDGTEMARKRATISDDDVQRVRKALWLVIPLMLAFVWLAVIYFFQTLGLIRDVDAGESIVSVWPTIATPIPAALFFLTVIIVGVFRAIPWPQAFDYAQRVLVWLLWPLLVAMAFDVIGVPPLSSYYMSTHGYHRCERFELGATRRWFTDWVKDPKWCVPGKGSDWVKEQAAKEAAEKPRSP